MSWSFEKFNETLMREKTRIANNPYLSAIERETIVVLLDEVLWGVGNAEPPRIGHGIHMDDDFIQTLRDALRARQVYRKNLGHSAFIHYPLDLQTAEEIKRDGDRTVNSDIGKNAEKPLRLVVVDRGPSN